MRGSFLMIVGMIVAGIAASLRRENGDPHFYL